MCENQVIFQNGGLSGRCYFVPTSLYTWWLFTCGVCIRNTYCLLFRKCINSDRHRWFLSPAAWYREFNDVLCDVIVVLFLYRNVLNLNHESITTNSNNGIKRGAAAWSNSYVCLYCSYFDTVAMLQKDQKLYVLYLSF